MHSGMRMTVATSAVIMQWERDQKVQPQAVYLPAPVEKCGYWLGPLQNKLQSSFLELYFSSIYYLCVQTQTYMDLQRSREAKGQAYA